MIVKKSSGQLAAHLFAAGSELMFKAQGIALTGNGEAPEWVQLLEKGENQTVDGRGAYKAHDLAAIIAETVKRSVDGKLPIDINHSINLSAPLGQPSPAIGWMTEFAARADGIWAKVEWTGPGKQQLADKSYRYISPVLYALEDNTVVFIARASLVNSPALHGLKPLLNAQKTENDDMDLNVFLAKLRAALGLAADADATVALAAIETLKTKTSGTVLLASVAEAVGLAKDATAEAVLLAAKSLKDPAKFVPAETVALLQTQLGTLTKSIATDKAALLVDKAIADGKPGVKPLREHYLARAEKDYAAVEKEIGAMISFTGPVNIPVKLADGEVLLSAEDESVCKLMGLDPKAFAATKKLETSAGAGH